MQTTMTHDLARTTPESQGVSSAAIVNFVESLERQVHEMHSFTLLRHGSVIAEGAWSPYPLEAPHSLFSVSKSFTSTAVGLALHEGHFSLDDTVLSFFPDDAPTEVSANLAAMRVRHLLTMTTGHADDTWTNMIPRADGNWIQGFLNTPVVHAPGTHFLYNTGATYMLSAIVQKTTGLKLIDYLTPRLFAPLGIDRAAWEESPQGINVGGIGLSITAESLAKFGQLYLQNGVWQGRQILPEGWTDEATRTQVADGMFGGTDWVQGYGYQFWRCRHNAYRGDGVFGQFCIVMPDQDAVLALTGGIDIFDSQIPLDLVWDILLPAMSADALPDDVASHAGLTQKLAHIEIAPLQGQASSPLTGKISGRVYAFDENPLALETMTLNFAESGCTVTVKTAAGVDMFSCGFGEWQSGRARLFPESPVVAVSGAWTADDSLTMVVRLVETPFYYTLVYYFDGDELMVEGKINVSLEAPLQVLLTGQARG